MDSEEESPPELSSPRWDTKGTEQNGEEHAERKKRFIRHSPGCDSVSACFADILDPCRGRALQHPCCTGSARRLASPAATTRQPSGLEEAACARRCSGQPRKSRMNQKKGAFNTETGRHREGWQETGWAVFGMVLGRDSGSRTRQVECRNSDRTTCDGWAKDGKVFGCRGRWDSRGGRVGERAG